MNDIIFNPIVSLLIIGILVYLLWAFLGKLSPALKPAKYKLRSYNCGEEQTGSDTATYGFFHVAFIFTVLHVGALLLATMPQNFNALMGIVIIISMSVTSVALLFGGVNDA